MRGNIDVEIYNLCVQLGPPQNPKSVVMDFIRDEGLKENLYDWLEERLRNRQRDIKERGVQVARHLSEEVGGDWRIYTGIPGDGIGLVWESDPEGFEVRIYQNGHDRDRGQWRWTAALSSERKTRNGSDEDPLVCSRDALAATRILLKEERERIKNLGGKLSIIEQKLPG